MKLCSPAALAALLCTAFALSAPSPAATQTAEPQALRGLSIEPRIVYLGVLTNGSESCGDPGCGWSSTEVSASVGPGGRLQVAGGGPLVLTAGLAVPREISGVYRASLVVGHLGLGYRIQPGGWILPVQVELGLTRVRANGRRYSGPRRWGLWGPSAGAELIARLNPRLFVTAGADILVLFPTHATAVAWREIGVSASKTTPPQYHAGVAIRVGHGER